jgi:bifunctional DNA-binding transcriptional regulator/antitoxin component of YhaV-PrlF toxin-antitoxin module
MAVWVRKAAHDLSLLRVSIPKPLVKRLGWEMLQYVTVESVGDQYLVIRRMPSDKIRKPGGTKHTAELD